MAMGTLSLGPTNDLRFTDSLHHSLDRVVKSEICVNKPGCKSIMLQCMYSWQMILTCLKTRIL